MYSYNISDKEAEPSPLSWGVPLSLSLTDSCVVLNNGCFAVHKNAAAVHSLKFHLVWCTKFRRPVLVKAVSLLKWLPSFLRSDWTSV
jgi:hypothetical protein